MSIPYHCLILTHFLSQLFPDLFNFPSTFSSTIENPSSCLGQENVRKNFWRLLPLSKFLEVHFQLHLSFCLPLGFVERLNKYPIYYSFLPSYSFLLSFLQGESKQKNLVVEGRNKRVLQDIGNLVAKQDEPGANVSKRIPRDFCAQLLANDQVTAEKNNKSSTELMNGVSVANFIVAAKVVPAQKPTEPEVIVISSDQESDEEKEKQQAVKGRKTRGKPGKDNVKAFSAVSKVISFSLLERGFGDVGSFFCQPHAACGLAYKPKDLVENIDAYDIDNELAASRVH